MGGDELSLRSLSMERFSDDEERVGASAAVVLGAWDMDCGSGVGCLVWRHEL